MDTKTANIYNNTTTTINPSYYTTNNLTIKALDLSNQIIKPTTNINIISSYYSQLKQQTPSIIKVEILKQNKVMRFTFSDNTIIKTICKDGDIFHFEFSFYLAYAKYFWHDFLTPIGIERKAFELMEIKFFNKLVDKGIKLYYKQEKEKEQKIKEENDKKRKQANKALKKYINKKVKRR